MSIISGASSKGKQLLNRAKVWEGVTLWDVYGNVSANKGRAYEDCKRWCEETNGYDFHICSHNSFQFCVAWEYMNPETGEVMTRIETANNTYIVDGSR